MHGFKEKPGKRESGNGGIGKKERGKGEKEEREDPIEGQISKNKR